MRILICGDRNWTDRYAISKFLERLVPLRPIIIEGEARGADKIAGEEASKLGFNVLRFPANWDKYGKAAGVLRNRQMLDQGPDLVVAFHNSLATSKGTKDCIIEAIKRGIKVLVITETGRKLYDGSLPCFSHS
jgi:hypothetical protein